MSIVKVGLVQMTCSADVNANKQKAIEKIKDAAKQGANVICLQELFTSLYFCDVEAYENFKLAEPIPGKTRIIKGLIDLGNEKRNVIIGGAQYYKPEDIIGKTVIVIANLEPKTMAGVESNAMLLAADVDDRPFWLTVNEDVPLGSPIK